MLPNAPELEVLGWVLLHSLWMGGLVAAALAIFLLLLKRRSAALRYWCGMGALALMVLLTAAIFVQLCGSTQRFSDPNAASLLPERLRVWLGGELASAQQPPVSIPIPGPIERSLTWIEPLLRWLCLPWIALVGLLALRQVRNWMALNRWIVRYTVPLKRRRLQSLARRLGVPQVRFLQTRLPVQPAAAGLAPPVVLMPEWLLGRMRAVHLEALAAHELAHIRRRDYLINAFQLAMETLLVFHPAAWWISRRIRQERENCCDDVAAAAIGDKLVYARALAEAVEQMAQAPPSALAAGDGVLLPRILRLVGEPEQARGPSSGLQLAWCLLLAVMLLGGTQLWASTSTIREARSWQQQIPFSEMVYRILEVPRSGNAFVPALIHAVKEKAHKDPAGQTMHWLAVALNQGADPQTLADLELPKWTVGGADGFLASPDWPYGSRYEHFLLAQAMWDHAKALRPGDPVSARLYARASLLLEAQNSYWLAAARFYPLLFREPAAELAGLREDQLFRLRAHFDVNHRTTLASTGYREQITQILEQEPEGKQRVSKIADRLRQLGVVTRFRPDVQYGLARQVWHLRSDPAAGLDLLLPLKQQLLDNCPPEAGPHLRRWLDEALAIEAPDGNGGLQRVQPKDVIRLENPPLR